MTIPPSPTGVLRRLFDPIADVLVAVIIVPEVELETSRDLSAAISRILAEIFDLAHVDPEQAIPAPCTLLNLILHPFARTCGRSNEDDRDGGSEYLSIDPVFDGLIALPLELLKVSCVDEASGLATLDYPAIANDHRSRDVVVGEAEEDSPCHQSLLSSKTPTTSMTMIVP